MTDLLYRVTFVFIFAIFWIVRIYYVNKTRNPQAHRSRAERRAAMKQEGWTGIVLIALTPVELILIGLFLWSPPWMFWADLLFPFWLHWVGIGVLIFSMLFMIWVHRTLGEHYSYALETKSEQAIVTSGPYARVRHPLYSAHTLFNFGMIFLTANIPLIILTIISIPLTYVRMIDEERMMVKTFGSVYEEYMQKTGRIFPKL